MKISCLFGQQIDASNLQDYGHVQAGCGLMPKSGNVRRGPGRVRRSRQPRSLTRPPSRPTPELNAGWAGRRTLATGPPDRSLRRQAGGGSGSRGFVRRLADALARMAGGCVFRGAEGRCDCKLMGRLEYRDKCFVQNAMRIERTVRTVEA
jgi:hypothetical protein